MGHNMNGMTSSRIVKSDLDSTGRLAYLFVWHWLKTMTEEKPGQTKRLWSEFEGMCKAANAVGYGYTPTAVELTVREVMRKRALPAFQAAGDQTRRDTWEFECVTELRDALAKIF